jgi:CDP-diacylglycerol--serine O-phosphatidyltransferase
MSKKLHLSKKVTALLVYGRPPLVFGGMICAIAVMWTRNPILYTIGVTLLFISMTFDLVDGWFAARFQPHPTLAHLADRLMDKTVYSIIFPLVAAGMMWRLLVVAPEYTRAELLHAILVLLLCVTVLVRDGFAHFMRGFATGPEPEYTEFTRLRTIVAAPVGALLYAHAFYVPEGPASKIYALVSTLGTLPLRTFFVIEIIFLTINFGSIAVYCRKYGTACLDELCLGDVKLRRRILSFFPNALTVMNAMMGLLAVFFAYQGRIREAYLFLLGAALFDKLDGALARRLGLTEPLPGEEPARRVTVGGVMDDISDAVSFCIVPAWIYYLCLSGSTDPVLQQVPVGVIAVLYALLGVARLIYFTLDRTPIPGFFKGLPTPAAALFVTAPLIVFSQTSEEISNALRYWGLFCSGLMVFTAVLMNLYPVHYLHLGRFMDDHPWFARASLVLLLFFALTPYFGHGAFFYLLIYVVSPLWTGRIEPGKVTAEPKAESGRMGQGGP